MLHIGCHLSSSKGFFSMAKTAIEIDADTFQFFTRNPRGSKAKNIDEDDLNKFKELISKNNFAKIIAHAPYVLNPSTNDSDKREFAKRIMKDDIERLELIGNQYYNFHPGNHLGNGISSALSNLSSLLNEILTETQTTTVLIETMCGKGTEVGSKFEEIKEVINNIERKDKIGVCIDTCHIFDGGYDIVNDLEGVVNEFDKTIGLSYLKAIHLNDSMNPLGSRKDRHQVLGKGYIGLECFKNIINHPKLKNLSFILETPNDLSGYKNEIKILRELYNN